MKRLVFALAVLVAAASLPGRASWSLPDTGPRSTSQKMNDLDAFMARVLERRDETWRKLHDYILDETEQFRLLGPGGLPLHGMKREFSWYVREGFLIRSPIRFDGVALSEEQRRAYEQRWLEEERKRETRAAEQAKAAKDAKGPADAPPIGASGQERRPEAGDNADPTLQEFVDQRGEPRFISEAYFLRFRFEPGNYYFAGRDTIDGRAVVKVEYYPTRLFEDDGKRRGEDGQARAKEGGRKRGNAPRGDKDKDRDEQFARQFNKVALVTLWIDPAEYQIVRYTFDNMDFGFLPGRWLVRVDEIRASMTMARVLDGVWLPAAIDARGGLSLASGAYQFEYARRFSNYKKAETGARIRSMVPRD